MNRKRVLISALLGVGLAWLVLNRRPSAGPAAITSIAPPAQSHRSAASPATTSGPATIESLHGETLRRLAYAQRWLGDTPRVELAAFRDWAEKFRAAGVTMRSALTAEGVALARARRPVMLDLIKTDPQLALAFTVPSAVHQELPAAVLAELETRVAGRGDLMQIATTLAAGEPLPAAGTRRVAEVGGVAYTVYVYGRREEQLTKEGASLHGIALDGQLALHESPLRVLEPGEIPAAAAGTHCPVSALAVAPLTLGEGVNTSALTVATAFGRVWEFCSTTDDMIAQFERRLVAAEESAAPRVAPVESQGGGAGVSPTVPAEAPTAFTIGTKQVLVIRVDTSDFPGDPVTLTNAQNILDGAVKPFFEQASYGQTTLVTTISSKTYRLPQSGAAYATGVNQDIQLHLDARKLAQVDYDVVSFDRVIVVFPNLSASRVAGSLFTFGGEGSVGGSSVWINGINNFALTTLSHELGHTYGLKHANLWQVTDGNPVSSNGTSTEYGDPFDAMGRVNDGSHHFNHWAKNRLGWLPDSSVTTVTTSDTYRLYRFDSKDAPLTQPLALRIFRDGARWYWIGYRRNFTANGSLSGGVYVVWGYNGLQQSELLDLTTPGASANDCALALGTTFTDAAYGVSITPIARGGIDPAQWLDVQVTVPAFAPNVVGAWGRNGSYIYDSGGKPVSPAPETAVPFDLTDVRAIAAGDAHALALKSDGSVVAWGDNTNGQITVPSDLGTDNVAIAAGGNISGVVKADGTIRLWGEAVAGVTTPPSNLSGVRQLAIGGGHASGRYHALALKNNGTVVAWGSNTAGESTVPVNLANVSAVAAGEIVSSALRADGTVAYWGSNNFSVPFPTGLTNIVAIASSGAAAHTLALRADGTVVGWGNNANSQTVVPAGLTNVVALATGAFHSLALKSDGSVVAWGSNTSGKSTVPTNLPRAYAVAATQQGSLALHGPHAYIMAQPLGFSGATGASGSLSVTAIGSGPLTYQWRKNGVAIPGATGSTFGIAKLGAVDVASYDVVVTDATSASSFTSNAAKIGVVTTTNPGRLINLSILTSVTASDQFFTVGAVIGGAGTSAPTKPLLIRAAGPSLIPLGVTGALADPKLTVFSGTTIVANNDNWGAPVSGAATLTAAMTQVGAFAYVSSSSLDAATLYAPIATTTPTSFTVQVAGVDGATGSVIAELYDATAASAFSATTPRLINVSVLKQIGAGDTLTAGFVIGGVTAKQVLIRAIGPTLGLAPFNVGGAMADPKVDLFSGPSLLRSNDNWGGDTGLASSFKNVGAFSLDAASKDAALLVTLAPGSYTAQVSGVAGASGFALVEVYEVP